MYIYIYVFIFQEGADLKEQVTRAIRDKRNVEAELEKVWLHFIILLDIGQQLLLYNIDICQCIVLIKEKLVLSFTIFVEETLLRSKNINKGLVKKKK